MGDNRVVEMAVTIAVLYTLSLFFTALRVYVRIVGTKNWGVDDTLLIATLVLYTVWSADFAVGLVFGSGRHIEDIPKGDVPHAFFTFWIGELLYTLTTVTLRLSIAVVLLRICFRGAHKMVIYCTMAMVLVFSTFYLLLAIFQCRPITYFWGQYDGDEGTCIEKDIFLNATYAQSAVSAAADFFLGTLPAWIMWDLKMNIRTKMSVGFVLSLGVIAGIAALIRIPYARALATTDDFLYATIDVRILSLAEPALGIIAAAACVLRPLFKKFCDGSSQGTPTQIRTQGLKWQKVQTWSRSITPEEGLELGQNPVGIYRSQSVVTSRGRRASMSNEIKIAPGRDKKVVAFIAKSIGGSNSSQEELTPKATGGGIQVERTVEVVREPKYRSTTSSDLPMP